MDLKGKIGYVTGAGSGMGRATALAMAREGAKLVLVGRGADKLEAVKREIEATGGEARIFAADVTQRQELRNSIDFAVSEYGRLDLAFNNAGGHADFQPIHQVSEEEAEWVIDLNFKAVFYGVKYQAQKMLQAGGGCIINNASIFGLKGMAGIAHYTACKFAVIGLTKAVALEYGGMNIRVNAVCPGGTETPNFLKATGGDVHAMDAMVPMGRIGQPNEVAEAAVWLMSAKASYVTGAILSIDGGMSAG